MGGTGYQPVPPGYQPGGTGRTLKGASQFLVADSPITVAPGISRVFGKVKRHNRFSGFPALLP